MIFSTRSTFFIRETVTARDASLQKFLWEVGRQRGSTIVLGAEHRLSDARGTM